MSLEPVVSGSRDAYRIASIGDRDASGVDADILVGGDAAKFEPLVISRKWDGEAWLAINAQRIITTERPVWDAQANRVALVLGNELHRWYELPDGRFEYDIVLGARPASNVFTFALDFPAGLDFFYQGPLTQWEIDRGNVRPPEVLGSYAVYWSKTNGKYRTGKFCHLYRPLCTDALGNRRYAALSVDPVAKTMTVTVPAAWLSSAAYPVVIDPTVGYTSEGGTPDSTNDYWLYGSWTATVNGTTANATAKMWGQSASGTVNAYMGLYQGGGGSPSGRSLLSAQSGALACTTTKSLVTASTTSWPAIVSGNQYGVLMNHTSGGKTYYDETAQATYYGLRTGGSVPSPTCPAEDGSLAWSVSIWFDYTEDTGGATTRGMPFGTRSTAFNGGRTLTGIIR